MTHLLSGSHFRAGLVINGDNRHSYKIDEEAQGTMATLGQNMAWLLDKIST
jgi:hypothetical protein